MHKTKFFSVLLALALLFSALSAPVMAAPASQSVPGFCQNSNGLSFNAERPLPATDPCAGASQFEIVSCETAIGFAADVKVFQAYTEAKNTCRSGIIWARPKTQVVGAQVAAAPAQAATPTQPTGRAEDCFALQTRDERLTCLDAFYRAGGETAETKARAWLATVGVSGEVSSVSGWQPDEDLKASKTPVVRGIALIMKDGGLPDGPSCITTDEPSRIGQYRVVLWIPNTSPVVGMFGGGVSSINGAVTVWADCSDWSEFEQMRLGQGPQAAGTAPTTVAQAIPSPLPSEPTPAPTAEAAQATTPPPTGGDTGSALLGLGLLGVIVAVVAALVIRDRRRGTTPPTPPSTP